MKIRLHLKPLIGLGILLLLVSGMSSCRVHNHFPLSYYGVKHLEKSKLKLYLIDNEHVLTKVWSMHAVKTHQDEISCRLKPVPEAEASQIVLINNRQDAEDSQNHVFFFATPSLIAQVDGKDSVTFDYHALEKISVVEKDGDAAANKILENLAIIFGVAFAIILFPLLLVLASGG
jgi:hypothetical protein